VLWFYHTTPHSTTKETPFTMVYGTDAMLPVEIDNPTWRRDNLSKEGSLFIFTITNKILAGYSPYEFNYTELLTNMTFSLKN
jgi:hypothetical protein